MQGDCLCSELSRWNTLRILACLNGGDEVEGMLVLGSGDDGSGDYFPIT